LSAILITGTTGLIGSELLRRILVWTPDSRVALLLRGRGSRTPQQRLEALLGDLFPAPGEAGTLAERIRIVEGDLQDERLGLTPREFDDLAADVGPIFHLGADVRFDQALEAARAVQVGGSRALSRLALASLRRGEFARFHHVSTFAAGRRSDVPVVPEEPPILDRSFRNTYEQSKAEAESVLLERAGDLPLTIHRVGIVVGDSRTGWTSKFDAFYMLMRLLLELEPTAPVVHVPVPGRALLNAVPIDFTTDALFALGQRRQDKSGTICTTRQGAGRLPFTTPWLWRWPGIAASSRRAASGRRPRSCWCPSTTWGPNPLPIPTATSSRRSCWRSFSSSFPTGSTTLRSTTTTFWPRWKGRRSSPRRWPASWDPSWTTRCGPTGALRTNRGRPSAGSRSEGNPPGALVYGPARCPPARRISIVAITLFAIAAALQGAGSSDPFHQLSLVIAVGNGIFAALYAVLLYRERMTAAA